MPIVCHLFLAAAASFFFIKYTLMWQLTMYTVFLVGGVIALKFARTQLAPMALVRCWPLWLLIASWTVIDLFSATSKRDFWYTFEHGAMTAGFVALCIVVFSVRTEHLYLLLSRLCVAAQTAALLSLGLHAVMADGEPLVPLGQPGLHASGERVYTLVCVLALHLYLSRVLNWRIRYLLCIALTASLLCMFASTEQLLMLVFLLVLGLLLRFHGMRPSARAYWVLAACSGVTFAIFALNAPIERLSILHDLLSGVPPARLDVLLSAMSNATWLERAIGFSTATNLAEPLPLGVDIVWRYGCIGFGVLMIAMCAAAYVTTKLWNTRDGHLCALLVAFLVLSLASDAQPVITQASGLLLYFWMPCALLAGIAIRNRESALTQKP